MYKYKSTNDQWPRQTYPLKFFYSSKNMPNKLRLCFGWTFAFFGDASLGLRPRGCDHGEISAVGCDLGVATFVPVGGI